VAEHTRQLELLSPMRDVKTLRTLVLLDLEAHPPDGPIDQVVVTIDPTPGRVVQHTLFTRPHPTPEQLSTLLARLGAVMGQDRVGAPAAVDTYRPGAFAMRTFAIEQLQVASRQSQVASHKSQVDRDSRSEPRASSFAPRPASRCPASAFRRCRHPVPARVAIDVDARPVRVTTNRRGFAGGAVLKCVGPWRSSGNWWEIASRGLTPLSMPVSVPWDHDEWDVALGDGAVYRIFKNRVSNAWFIDGFYD
jgi:protein ImuB